MPLNHALFFSGIVAPTSTERKQWYLYFDHVVPLTVLVYVPAFGLAVR